MCRVEQFVDAMMNATVHKAHIDNTMHNAQYADILPAHYFNMGAIFVSLFCFATWMFFSPHQKKAAAALDRSCNNP